MGWFSKTLGTLTGGLFGDTQSQRASDKLWKSSRYVPYNIDSGVGTATFNGTSAYGKLNPYYDLLSSKYRSLGDTLFGQLQGRSYDDLRNEQLRTMRKAARPEELRDITDMQTMLFNKGLLGSTAGNLQMNSLYDAQEQADLMRILESIGLAKAERENLFSLGSRAYEADIALQGMPLRMMELGSNIGSAASSANYTAGRGRYEADVAAEKSEKGFLGSLFKDFF